MSAKKNIRIFAPATVANVGPGFDVLGLALASVGDEVTMCVNDSNEIRLFNRTDSNLPLDPKKNVCGAVIEAMLAELGSKQGFDLTFDKKINPGSGIGSSAASCAAAAFGTNELLGHPFDRKKLVEFAMQGEKLATGSAHADNVAPAILGGFTLVRGYDPFDVVSLPYPADLCCVIVHPEIEVRTADSRMILKKEILLKDAVKQWGNVAGLVAGLMLSDYGLIKNSLHDGIIEPVRSLLIPGFYEVKDAARELDMLGCSISGSGPSIFALSNSLEKAGQMKLRMQEIFASKNLGCHAFVSMINAEGTKLIVD